MKECPNCKENKLKCACMRNMCRICNKPVGNITFTLCDECWQQHVARKTEEEHLMNCKAMKTHDTILQEVQTECSCLPDTGKKLKEFVLQAMREAAKQAFDKSYWTASDLRYTFEEYLKQVEP